MIILTIRTDKEEAEVGLYKADKQLAYETWQAHRTLATSLNKKIDEILNKSSIKLEEVGAIVCFSGPGSFTGLRIGLSTANALAYGLKVPIVARSGEQWLSQGIDDIVTGGNDVIAVPNYGVPPAITPPKN